LNVLFQHLHDGIGIKITFRYFSDHSEPVGGAVNKEHLQARHSTGNTDATYYKVPSERMLKKSAKKFNLVFFKVKL
jgi:hypothetical protein